jgi:hypothetical protein
MLMVAYKFFDQGPPPPPHNYKIDFNNLLNIIAMPVNYLNNCDNLNHPVKLPSARDEHLPTFFQVKSYPFLPNRQKGHIFVYEQDTTKKHMKDFSKWAKA